MAQVVWTAHALDCLADIYHYIDSEVYARRFISSLVKSVENQLQVFPQSGRYVPEFQNSPLDFLREVIFKTYRIVYDTRQVPDGKVIILAVQHGSRMDIIDQSETWAL